MDHLLSKEKECRRKKVSCLVLRGWKATQRIFENRITERQKSVFPKSVKDFTKEELNRLEFIR